MLILCQSVVQLQPSCRVIADTLSHDIHSFLLKVQGAPAHPPTNSGNPTGPTRRLDLTSLVQDNFHNRLAPSTHLMCDAALRRFNNFYALYDVYNPLPVTEKLLCYFVTVLAKNGLAPQTIKSYLSVVRSMQISLGLPPPSERYGGGGGPPRTRLPITATVLCRIEVLLKELSNLGPLGNSHNSLLRIFPPQRVAGCIRISLQPFNPPQLGCHGDACSAAYGKNSPENVQV